MINNNVKMLTMTHRLKIETNVYVTLIGKQLTLKDLIDLRCPNFIAARRLEKNLKKLGIKTISQLVKLDPYSLFNTRGVGIGQVFVAECLIFKYADINPYKWYEYHLTPRKKKNHEV